MGLQKYGKNDGVVKGWGGHKESYTKMVTIDLDLEGLNSCQTNFQPLIVERNFLDNRIVYLKAL